MIFKNLLNSSLIFLVFSCQSNASDPIIPIKEKIVNNEQKIANKIDNQHLPPTKSIVENNPAEKSYDKIHVLPVEKKEKTINKPIQKLIITETTQNQIKTKKEETSQVVLPEVQKTSPKIEEAPKLEKPKNPISIFSHDIFEQLLQKYVDSAGKVNYTGIKDEIEKLESYLENLNNQDISDWSKDKKLAYWINVYNANTIHLLASNYPVKSIMDINGGKAWDLKIVKTNGKTYTLNQVENEIIRPQFKDPRIHFAVNCGAVSCPPIWNHAWTESNLQSTLTQKTKDFLASQFNEISVSKLNLSKIFEWYSSDFEPIIDFINQYSNIKVNPKAKIKFIAYNWDLNKQ